MREELQNDELPTEVSFANLAVNRDRKDVGLSLRRPIYPVNVRQAVLSVANVAAMPDKTPHTSLASLHFR